MIKSKNYFCGKMIQSSQGHKCSFLVYELSIINATKFILFYYLFQVHCDKLPPCEPVNRNATRLNINALVGVAIVSIISTVYATCPSEPKARVVVFIPPEVRIGTYKSFFSQQALLLAIVCLHV